MQEYVGHVPGHLSGMSPGHTLDPAIHHEKSAADISVEIAPFWIEGYDEIDFPLARPMLDVLFALDRQRNRFVLLVVDEHLHIVTLREAFNESLSMFECAPNEIVGDANVQRSTRFSSEDI